MQGPKGFIWKFEMDVWKGHYLVQSILKMYLKKDTLILSWILFWYVQQKVKGCSKCGGLIKPGYDCELCEAGFCGDCVYIKKVFLKKQFLVICRCTSSWSRITQLLVTLSNLFCWLASFSPRWATATRWFANPATTAKFWLLPNIQTFNTTCL